ncbi:LysR family transcriptional regulator [Methylobacterium sp. Leaf466]|uniref:LysR family transcriptional regulator n=1 Tax=Methylobacterium sp. Leaf466 TaxID=1736386 RepID=UPI000701F3DF|nr:LysR family transcriptional regulator [Methylobacterium sp. Leaf466]KQT81854.1 LysR family transcriptional regulator [Methylobacterium sp. Leaf466]
MLRESLNDLSAFVAVARAGSFTKAAAQIGVSQPALSQTVRALEARLGIRLLARTTRSVSATEAGQRLLKAVGPRFDEIEAGLVDLAEIRGKPAGTIRITADEHAARTILWPALRRVLPDHPEIKVETIVDYGLTDIVAEGIDAGVRLGGTVAKDMAAVRISPDMRMAAVAAPSYLADRPIPRRPEELTDHSCITLRQPTHGGLYAWEFEKGGRNVRVWVEGQLVFNTVSLIQEAALGGFGIAYLSQDQVQACLDDGRLVRVLDDWCPPFSGYHLYYPSRSRPSPAFALLVEALRYRS